jgi:hypothetical protein
MSYAAPLRKSSPPKDSYRRTVDYPSYSFADAIPKDSFRPSNSSPLKPSRQKDSARASLDFGRPNFNDVKPEDSFRP